MRRSFFLFYISFLFCRLLSLCMYKDVLCVLYLSFSVINTKAFVFINWSALGNAIKEQRICIGKKIYIFFFKLQNFLVSSNCFQQIVCVYVCKKTHVKTYSGICARERVVRNLPSFLIKILAFTVSSFPKLTQYPSWTFSVVSLLLGVRPQLSILSAGTPHWAANGEEKKAASLVSDGERSTGVGVKGITDTFSWVSAANCLERQACGFVVPAASGINWLFLHFVFNCLILLKVCRENNTPLLLRELAGDAEIT